MQILITEMMCSTETLLNIRSSTRPVPHPPTVAEGPPPERDKIDAQSSRRAQEAFEGPLPEEWEINLLKGLGAVSQHSRAFCPKNAG